MMHDAWSIVINSSGHLYCGAINSGVYESADDGISWQKINSGLSNLSVIKLAFSHNGYLFAATDGGGLYRSLKKVTHVKHIASAHAAVDILERTFPNPANAYTTARFTIQQSGFVAIHLYNSVGQKTMIIANNHFQRGSHQLHLQTDVLASRIYWLQIQTARSKITKK